LDDNQWSAPQELQQWLQYTHEVELKHYNAKKAAAEKQLTTAKEGCEKIRKKRSTFMGSLRIAHSNSIDAIDQRILMARSALEEVREDLQERLHRWRQIELYCGFPIINNPGLAVLETAIREGQANGSVGLTRRGSRDLLDDDMDDTASTYTTAPTEPKGRGKFYALGLAAMYGNNSGLAVSQGVSLSPPPVTLRHSSSYSDLRKRGSLTLEGLYQANASPMLNRRSLTSETLGHMVRSSSTQDMLTVRDQYQSNSRDVSPVGDVRFSLDGYYPELPSDHERPMGVPIPNAAKAPTHFPFINAACASPPKFDHFPRSISLQDHQVQRPPSRPATQSLSSADIAIGTLDRVLNDHSQHSPPVVEDCFNRNRMNTQNSVTSITSASSVGTGNESETPSIVIEEDDDDVGTGDENKPEEQKKKKKKLLSKLLRKDPDKHKKDK